MVYISVGGDTHAKSGLQGRNSTYGAAKGTLHQDVARIRQVLSGGLCFRKYLQDFLLIAHTAEGQGYGGRCEHVYGRKQENRPYFRQAIADIMNLIPVNDGIVVYLRDILGISNTTVGNDTNPGSTSCMRESP